MLVPSEPLKISSLPDEILAAILKFVSDAPIPTRSRLPPFPISATQISRRFRELTLASSELWTHIHLSHRSRSLAWAAQFLKRSGTRSLDISVNLRPYLLESEYYVGASHRQMEHILALIGPSLHRWNTFSVHARWIHQAQKFCEYILANRGAFTADLHSIHISILEVHLRDKVPWLKDVFSLARSVRSLRVHSTLHLQHLSAFRCVHRLDIDLSGDYRRTEVSQLLNPSSSVTTLILRNFPPFPVPPILRNHLIDAPTITSLAVSFSFPFACDMWTQKVCAGFHAFTQTFALPNLESLEIMGNFCGPETKDSQIDSPRPLPFPRLQTLRLKESALNSSGVSLIRYICPDISALELIHTTGNEHLAVKDSEALWSGLESLTIDEGWTTQAHWLPEFLAAHPGITTLIIPPRLRHSEIPIPPTITVRLLLSDGSPPDSLSRAYFFAADNAPKEDMDFYGEEDWWYCSHCREEKTHCLCARAPDMEAERRDGLIFERFKRGSEWARIKGRFRQLRRSKNRKTKKKRGILMSSSKRSRTKQDRDEWDMPVEQDFCFS
ncbi:hypothetical protein R3P38DRAFT_2827813, partial [Favolaschia claudopus]